ncbi:MAG: hypothetical protein ACYTG0_27760 [Planctomycetota bacterium]|jgi:hypothetical protein
MPDQLPVPPDLQHLIEKREQEDRRNDIRRKTDVGAIPPEATPSDADPTPEEERRTESERRKKTRRKADADS